MNFQPSVVRCSLRSVFSELCICAALARDGQLVFLGLRSGSYRVAVFS